MRPKPHPRTRASRQRAQRAQRASGALYVSALYMSALALMTPACSKKPAPEPALTQPRQGALPGQAEQAAGPDACAQDPACKRSGLCVSDPETSRCVATRDADCAASERCAQDGECAAGEYFAPYCKCDAQDERQEQEECGQWQRQRCVVDEAGCRASARCKERGACSPRTWCGGHACVSTKDEDCAASERCKTHGECALLASSSVFDCGPTTTAHCAQAQICLRQGRCRLGEGVCQ